MTKKPKSEPMPSDDPETTLVSAGELAELVGRSRRWVDLLRETGKIQPVRRGLYLQGPALRAALAAVEEGLRSKAQRTQRASRTVEARTREIELRIAEREAELVPAADAIEVIRLVLAAFKSEFGALAARHTQDPIRRGELQAKIDESLSRVDAQALRAESQIRTGQF